jgi:hypothetical protein
MNLELVRFAYLATATLGWLRAGDLRLATLEEPWRPDPDGPGGQRREGAFLESCVQDGDYTLEPHASTKHPISWALVNHRLGAYHWPKEIPLSQKWGRSTILIHTGNSTEDIEGCILVGLSHGTVDGKPWVYNSGKAFDQLIAVLGANTTHQLLIRPRAGTAEAA